MKDIIYKNNIQQIGGWLSEEKFNTLFDLVVNSKPSNILEIGVFMGKSFFTLAWACKYINQGRVIGLDPLSTQASTEFMEDSTNIEWWTHLDYEKINSDLLHYINDNLLSNYCEFVRTTSQDYIHNVNYEIDILHIDGNHEEQSAIRDVELYYPKVKQGGYILFDDAKWYQTQKAVSLLENHFMCELLQEIPSEDPNNFCNLYRKV